MNLKVYLFQKGIPSLERVQNAEQRCQHQRPIDQC